MSDKPTDVVEKLLALTEKDYGPGTKMWIHGAMVEVCQRLKAAEAVCVASEKRINWQPSEKADEGLNKILRNQCNKELYDALAEWRKVGGGEVR